MLVVEPLGGKGGKEDKDDGDFGWWPAYDPGVGAGRKNPYRKAMVILRNTDSVCGWSVKAVPERGICETANIFH